MRTFNSQPQTQERSKMMQHARIFNGKQRPKPKEKSNLNPNKFDATEGNSLSNSLGSNQLNLIVGAPPSINSRSSSVQMVRTLNAKTSENTIVVGRHLDRNPEFDRGFLKDRTVSQNDSLDSPSLNPSIPSGVGNSTNTVPRISNYRNPLLPYQLTVWFHELRSSGEDFMIDLNLLPNFKIGDIIELETLEHKNTKKPKPSVPTKILFIIKEQNILNNSTTTPVINPSSPSTPVIHAQVNTGTPNSQDVPSISDQLSAGPVQSQNVIGSGNIGSVVQSPAVSQITDEDSPTSDQSTTVQPVISSNKAKNVIQISLINNPLQKTLDLLPRSIVQIRKIGDIKSVEADLIEISIKNINLSRDTMWIITSELTNSCVYHGKRVSFLNNRVGIIKNIYQNGKKHFSGYIGTNTKIVYRSESSRLIFLIQTSREMWHFEESGEIMFHKLVNNLFPRIFRKWREKDANHSITIVLFTSVDLTDIPWTALGHGERPNKVREYFRVVVDQVSIVHWSTIMETLRLEFANFKRDIMMNRINNDDKTFSVEGVTLPAVKGNILEALNIGLNLIKDRFTDTDLKHSLNHLVVITPGTGLFDVDYNLMIETSKKMSNTDCSLDIICLSQPPLHIVPLFRFKDLSKNGKLTYCVPYWCDISFYKDSSLNKDQWIPRCKIYELQMMGLMENEVNEIEIQRFKKSDRLLFESMDSYDSDIFKPVSFTRNIDRDFSKNNSFSSTRSLVKLPAVTPKLVHDSLSLINQQPQDSKYKPLARFNIGTTNSTALGMVTNLNPESSALSSLYQLKTDGTATSKRPRSIISVRSMKSNGELKLRSSSPKRFSKLKPEEILRPQEPAKNQDILGPNQGSFRPNQEIFRTNMENFRPKVNDSIISLNKLKSETTTLKKSSQMSGSSEIENDQKQHNLNPFWTEIFNPSKESHSDALSFIKLGKWNQVFPSNIKRSLVKWRSFQSPAALPVYQPNFPTNEDLETNYTTQVYTLLLNYENHMELGAIEDLMREMIQLRLLLGFQICDSEQVNKVESERNPDKAAEKLIKYFTPNFYGSKIYMMLDNEIHRLGCDDSSIGVQLYHKIESAHLKTVFKNQEFDFKNHKPLIRTRYSDEYSSSATNFIDQKPTKYNWNQFDQLLAGYEDALPEENRSFFKMKFVVMPAEIPKNAYFITNEKLTDEEIRVEGLRKLIAMIERGKYTKDEKKRDSDRKKEGIVPEISFYTGNLYDFLTEQVEIFDSTGNQPENSLMITDKLNKSIKLLNLAHELQSSKDLTIVDRTWHFSVHENCFVGNELVSWLFEHFEDIETREDATKYGQTLMDKGLFKHVENRHGFLDGYYFYELEPDYVDKTLKPEKSSSWFGRKKEATPNSDGESLKSPLLGPSDNSKTDLRRIASIGNQLSTNNSFLSIGGGNDSETSSVADSSGSKKTKRKFVLSRSVKYNADPLKKSYRPELLRVHYDRVHNPEHCYHIRLQWLNTTTNFIDETISNWSRLCERHGLKFVETPWKELCTIPEHNPFHSFVELKLALNPFTEPEFNSSKILASNKFYYHLYLLQNHGFLLDNRSAVYFSKENIEISYSWGNPSFKYAQFIHKTGAYIVEVRDNGNFVLAPNNMHISRANPIISTNDVEIDTSLYTTESQKIMLRLRKTCNSRNALMMMFRDAKSSWRDELFT